MATIAPEMDVSTVLLDVMFQVPKLIGAVGGKALCFHNYIFLRSWNMMRISVAKASLHRNMIDL